MYLNLVKFSPVCKSPCLLEKKLKKILTILADDEEYESTCINFTCLIIVYVLLAISFIVSLISIIIHL